jgi:hypothetical protein
MMCGYEDCGFEKGDSLSRDNEKGRGTGYSFRNPTSILSLITDHRFRIADVRMCGCADLKKGTSCLVITRRDEGRVIHSEILLLFYMTRGQGDRETRGECGLRIADCGFEKRDEGRVIHSEILLLFYH